MKTCIACGMPMKTASDYPSGDTSKDYCVYCARQDGSMQNYEEKLQGMADFMIKTQGLDERVALNAAKKQLNKLPAWENHYQK